MSLPDSLERAASELAALADKIRPANGDPHRLLDELSRTESGQLLGWVLNEEPDAAAELVEAWGESDEGVQVLLTATEEGVAKPGRKVLRKARHRLRSQGIEVQAEPEAARTGAGAAPSVEADRWEVAHVSTPDFRGARMGYLVDRHPNGGARLFEIRFDPARGVQDFKIYNAGRSKVRGFLKSLTAGSQQRLFECDREALCALVARASRAQPTDRPLPTSFVEWRSRLFSEALAGKPTPGEQTRAQLSSGADADVAGSLSAIADEIKAGAEGPWPPATSWVSDRMETGRETVEGLDGEARANRIEAWIEEVATALDEETDATLLAHHLDELAWSRQQSGDEAGARRLLCVSTQIAETGPEAQKAGQALARARVESLFGPYLEELRVVEEKV